MAKKVKRNVRPVERRVVDAVEATAPVTEASAQTGFRATATSRRTMTAAEFNPDYTYVRKDLKRIGTLAGTFFVVLIVLSFIIR